MKCTEQECLRQAVMYIIIILLHNNKGDLFRIHKN